MIPHRTSTLMTLWIMAASIFIMVFTCFRAIFQWGIGRMTREWVDYYVRIWARRLLLIVKVNYRVINPHNVSFQPEQRYIIMSNHSSLYDIPLIFMALPGSIRMVAKKDLKRVPFMSQAMQLSEFLFIDRNNPRQAILDLRQGQDMLYSGLKLWFGRFCRGHLNLARGK